MGKDTLMMYDVLRAQILAGALIYKISEHIPAAKDGQDDIIWEVTPPLDELTAKITVVKKMYVMRLEVVPEFIDACTQANIAAIALEDFVKAEHEAFLAGKFTGEEP